MSQSKVVRRMAVVLAVMAGFGAAPALGQADVVWVNTTEDLSSEAHHCLPGQVCTLRKALESAEGRQRTISACFEPGVFDGAAECPSGVMPLNRQDPNFNAATKRWHMEIGAGTVSFILAKGGTKIDFTRGIANWSGPQDNRVVLDGTIGRDGSSGDPRTDLILVEGTDNVLSGFEIRGEFSVAAIIVRQGAANNQFGPGLVFAGMPQGVGIVFENRGTVANKVIGSWCGITGDGRQVDPLADDCIRFHSGAGASIVGGSAPQDRNVLVGSSRGVGVSVEGLATRDITIQGNHIGIGPDGSTAVGNEAGVRVVDGASGVHILGNIIAGNRNTGIAVFGESRGIRIEENRIGLGSTGTACVANTGPGISLQGGVTDASIARNVIHCNSDGGILLRDGTVQAVTITQNSLSRNQGKPIVLAEGANLGIQPPSLEPKPDGSVEGRACPGCTVELFSDPSGEAEVYEGTITADAIDGTFLFSKDAFAYRALRGTSTDAGNTSALCPPAYLPREPRPTNTPFGYKTPTARPSITASATASVGTPEPTSTRTGEPGIGRALMPWVGAGQ